MEFFPLVGFAVMMTLSPGPNTALVMASAMNRGLKASLPLCAGICVGFPLMIFIMGLFMEPLLGWLPQLKQILNVVFVIVLLALVYSVIRDDTQVDSSRVEGFQVKGSRVEASIAESSRRSKENTKSFIVAFVFQWLNPKAWLTAISVYGVFSGFALGELSSALTIALVFVVVTIPCVGAWLLVGSVINGFALSRKRRKVLNYVFASIMLVAVAVNFSELTPEFSSEITISDN
ncbi:MAG: threonine/homoserine/homoserine lactone efflux protein [Flavobacteriales bacterium]|jgi:threonine/homoserine/homoserine lactone efflux protein